MNLIIARHGETIENALGICQGQSEGKLSVRGVAQSKLLSAKINESPVDLIYSSSLHRALQTAEIIKNNNPELCIKTDSRLNERYFGPLQGKPFPTGYNFLEAYPGAESIEEVFFRAQSFLEEIILHHPGQRIVVVSHGIAIVALMAVLTQTPLQQMHSIRMPDNASFTECEVVDSNKVIFSKM